MAARDLPRAQAFARRHGLPRAYGSYRELAEDPDVGETPRQGVGWGGKGGGEQGVTPPDPKVVLEGD